MRTPRGKQAFLEYYHTLFPDDSEFSQLFDSLSKKRLPVLRFSPLHEERLKKLWNEHQLSWQVLDWYPQALLWPVEASYGEVLPGYTEHLFYPMSASSLLPIIALELHDTDLVLDACAAPGGKALAIASGLRNPNQLTVNDLSYERVMRMKRVFHDYGVEDIVVRIGPGEKLQKHYFRAFDKVLVDAPCSSEQHVWNSPKHLAEWSHNRVKKLQRRQIGLVTRLLDTVKPGGRLVYSTCAITPEENDDVVTEVLKARSNVRLIPELGKRTLPHRDAMDPMFVAVFGV